MQILSLIHISRDREENLQKAEDLVRTAAEQRAQIILLQELFETRYFCQTQHFASMDLARALSENPAVKRLSVLAKETETVIPVSFFERYGNTAFNSVAVLDADGSVLGVYRKTHIPDGLPYAEKFYFTPGDTGFRVWNTRYGRIGVGICWDQWFPEAARSLSLIHIWWLLLWTRRPASAATASTRPRWPGRACPSICLIRL